ncbi:MAG: DUF424 family protein [Desulfurococcales archaeon]|nr:DUF424 family protein [Desulfurococcales archaeon]
MMPGESAGSCSGSNRYYLKIVDAGAYRIVSLVDEDVLGRVERDPESGITISLPRSFYEGRLVDEAEAIKIIASHDYVILAGCRAVQLGIELGVVDPRSVLEVNGLKYVHVMRSYF